MEHPRAWTRGRSRCDVRSGPGGDPWPFFIELGDRRVDSSKFVSTKLGRSPLVMVTFARGRRSDFEETYHGHYAAVVRSAWSVTRDRASAEEHAQEAFTRAYARWRSLHRSGYVVAWVHRVAINLAIDELRRRRRQATTTGEMADGEPQPLEQLVVAEALSRLTRRQREAVVLRVMAELPESDVAELMGVSIGSVKTHKSRGLARLRSLMRQEVAHG